MAGGVQSGHGWSRNRGEDAPISEINVTPFVDVMLVLLIIFMVSAPLMVSGVPIEIPDSEASALPGNSTEPLQISVSREGEIRIGDDPVSREALETRMRHMAESSPDRLVHVRADRQLDYGAIMEVMAIVSRSGVQKIGLVSSGTPVTRDKAPDAS